MFNFRIINLANGDQVIDPSLKTPYESLTPSQMEDYIETSKQITYMERMEKREQKQAEWKRRMKNPLYKIAYFCGLVHAVRK